MGEAREEEMRVSGMAVRRFYVDVHSRVDWKPHTVFDCERFKMVWRLSEIDAKDGDEVYVDSLPAEAYRDVIDLMKRGVRVFRLKRLDILPKLRAQINVEKTHENDAFILSTLDENFFRELHEEEVRLRMLIAEYNKLLRLLKRMRQLDCRVEGFAEARRIIRRAKDRLAEQIAAEAETIIPRYREVCERLGLSDNDVHGKAALADLMLNIDFNRGLRKILSYLGRHQHNRSHYNKRIRMALERLSMSYYQRRIVRAKEQVKLLKTIRGMVASQSDGGEEGRMRPGTNG